jgi:HK97 family phage portal protein
MSFWDWLTTSPPSRPEDATDLSVSDPALAAYFSPVENYSGVQINEDTAMALSAVFRAGSVIAGTLAGLPLRSLEQQGSRVNEVSSILDTPGGKPEYGVTKFEWKETLFWHLLLHGNTFIFKVKNGAGAIARLDLIHPLHVSVRVPTVDEITRGEVPLGGKWFEVTLADGTRARYDAATIMHIPYVSLDGIEGLSPIAIARNSFGVAAAGDRAAAKMFNSGALIQGLVTPDGDDVDDDDVKAIRQQLDRSVVGWENASAIPIVNRRLKFTPWTMSAADAQFLQSRQFQIEEIARWYGVPPHLLMQTDKQTSWGTGVESQNRALGRTVLGPWASRVEQRLSRLLAPGRWAEFDFAALERPSPEVETGLLIQQSGGPIMTPNEARDKRNLKPVEGGDALRGIAAPGEPADASAE